MSDSRWSPMKSWFQNATGLSEEPIYLKHGAKVRWGNVWLHKKNTMGTFQYKIAVLPV